MIQTASEGLPISVDYSDELMLVIVVLSILASAFFSLAETALTSLSPMQSERLIEKAGWFNTSLRHWINQSSRLLTTILVCNTVANTTAATFGTLYLERAYPDAGVISITIVLTLVILVLCEIIPKVVARGLAEKFAPFACRTLIGFHYLFYPLTYLLTRLISLVLGTFGVILQSKYVIRASDIEYMINHAGREGSIEKDKSKILTSVFQFSKRRVKDIMVPRERIRAIPVNKNILEVLDIVRSENHSRYPVYNNSLDRIVGFLHARDLFGIIKAYGFSEGNKTPLESISLRTCLRRAFFISEHAMISRVLNEMKSNRIHLAIVKDEWGNVVGLITLEDILEEVFGEIDDEHDEREANPVVDLYSTGVEVAGSESVVDLKAKYEIELEPSDSYSTLNGFLQHYASHQLLTPKTVIIWEKYVFSILSVKDGEIEKVRITEIPEDKE